MTKIAKIRINNILGIDELEFDAGQFNQISGPNGTGKTSVLEAIKATLRGGHDATLLRTGAEKGETVLVLDDGTEISKRVTPAASTTVVKNADGKRESKPADTIKRLTDLISINPVDFLRATKKERVNVLLESLPIEIDHDRLEQIAGKAFTEYPVSKGRNEGTHALILIDSIRTAIFNERTGTNRAAKEKHATINQLADTLPDGEVDAPASADDLLAQIAEADQKRDAELQRIDTKLAGLRAEAEERIEALRQQIADEQRKFSEIQVLAGRQREMTISQHRDSTQAIRDNLSAIQAAQRAAAKHEATRQTIATMNEDAARLQAEADAQTAAIEGLDAYKSELLANLPIKGLTVEDGEIFRSGVQFDRLNTAQQVEIAVEIAKLRAGELGVICCDGLELLDSERYAEFQKQTIASGMQMFITRVSDDAFNITTREAQ
jgi:hypothetical protein